jgi:Flp pilus assembly protein TadG
LVFRRPLRLFGDRGGNVALIFALCLIPLVLIVGGGLDLRREITSRGYVQDAADAAVLTAANNYFNNYSLAAGPRLAAAQAAAEATMTAELVNRAAIVLNRVDSLTVNATTGALQLHVAAQSPTLFGALFGLTTLSYGVDSYAAAGGKPVEIALMLDNTASMFQIGTGGSAVRFTTMRQAAESYVNQVFDLGGSNVKVSVIPWATLVNINSEPVAAVDPSAYAAPTVPPMGSGRTPIAPAVDHTGVLAEPAAPTTALTAARLALLSKPTSWRGCVRSANGEVAVNSSGAVTQAITDSPPSSGKWPAALLGTTMSLSYSAPVAAYTSTSTSTPTICDQTGPVTTTTTTTVCDSYVTVPGTQGALHRRRFGEAELDFADDRHVVGHGVQLGVSPRQAEWNRLFHRTTQVCVASHTVTTTTTTTGCIKSHLGTPVTTTTNHPATAQSCSINEYYSGDLAQYNAFLPDNSVCTSPASPNAAYPAAAPPVCQSDPNDISYLNAGKISCNQTKAATSAWWRPDAINGSTRNWNAETQAISGPNMNCPVPILPLSSNRAQVLNKLNEMYPVPTGTLTDVGILWGLRTLSPNSYWTSFWGLSGKQVPAAFNNPGTYKIGILLSDGANEAPYWMEGYYGCTDATSGTVSTPSSSRKNAGNCWRSPNLGTLPRTPTADNTAATNMMLSACNQMRTVYGVDLYYILVDVTDPTALATATQCAPGAGHAISTSSGDLQSVFNSLVSRTLHLTH